MGLFSKKQKVDLEEFCRIYYNDVILNPKEDITKEYPEIFKKEIVEAIPEFESVSLEKIKEEIKVLTFELFALAWIHNFGEGLAIKQSIFTKKYLYEKGRNDIWEGMEFYNGAISHSIVVKLSELNKAYLIKKKTDLFDKYYATYKDNNETPVEDSLGLAINRISSEEVWKKRIAPYFLMLALCSKFGLGSGKEYRGPNENAQSRFISAIMGIYSGINKYFDNVEINKK